MRKTFRSKNNKQYWKNRWESVVTDEPMSNHNKYPLKYALEVIGSTQESILEAGFGNSRILRYFHQRGYNIEGLIASMMPYKISKNVIRNLI
jgi:hypothetical protein